MTGALTGPPKNPYDLGPCDEGKSRISRQPLLTLQLEIIVLLIITIIILIMIVYSNNNTNNNNNNDNSYTHAIVSGA